MFFNFLVKKSNFFFKLFGLQLSYINTSESNKYKWLTAYNIDAVIDIGANQGQFALKIFKAIEPKFIYSFEPIASTFQLLKEKTEKYTNIKVFNIGIGEENKFVDININSHSPSSSLLPLADFHKNSYPEFIENAIEKIEIKTLDSLISDREIQLTLNTLLKIDVQGFEKFVLLGAIETLHKVKMVYVEVSFVEMYAKQPLFTEIYDYLIEQGFQMIGADNLALDSNNSKPLFFDAYFIRNN